MAIDFWTGWSAPAFAMARFGAAVGQKLPTSDRIARAFSV